LEIVKQRLTEERRDRLAHSIKEAREEYRKGKVKKGTVDDLLRDLEK
jgi:ribosome recycling factor